MSCLQQSSKYLALDLNQRIVYEEVQWAAQLEKCYKDDHFKEYIEDQIIFNQVMLYNSAYELQPANY